MNYEYSVVRYVILSTLIGFLAFIVCYSYVVWRKRQKGIVEGNSTVWNLRSLGLFGVILGIGGLGFSIASREVIKSSGTLTGDDLFTVRTLEGFQASYRAEEGAIRKGDKLVSFAGPELDLALTKARANVLKQEAKLQKIEAELLPRDPELVRQLTRASNRVDQLEIMLRQLIPNSELLNRDEISEITKLKNDLHKIEGEYRSAQADEQHALASLEIIRKQLERDAKLVDRGAVTLTEYEQRWISYRKAEAELAKARATAAAIELQKKELNQALSQLLTRTRSTLIPKELAQIQKDLEAARAEERAAQQRLDADLPRAQRLHALEIVQAKRELEGAREALSSLENSREILAPFSGRVVYKNPAQDTPKLRGPLVVLAKEQGLICKVRLPAAQIQTLKPGEPVVLQAATETGGTPYVFPATFQDKMISSGIDPYVTGLFQCLPPPDVISRIAEGEPLKVTLDWRPPLWTLWPFRLGVGTMVFGLICWILAGGIFAVRPRQIGLNHPTSSSRSDSVIALPKQDILPTSDPALPLVPTLNSDQVIRPPLFESIPDPPEMEPVAPPTVAELLSISLKETLPEVALLNDDPKPDYEQNDEPKPDYEQNDEPKPDYEQNDEPKPDYEQIAWNLCQSIHAGTVTSEQVTEAETALLQGGPMATMYFRRTFRNDPSLLNSISHLWLQADQPEAHLLVLRLDRLIASVGITKPVASRSAAN